VGGCRDGGSGERGAAALAVSDGRYSREPSDMDMHTGSRPPQRRHRRRRRTGTAPHRAAPPAPSATRATAGAMARGLRHAITAASTRPRRMQEHALSRAQRPGGPCGCLAAALLRISPSHTKTFISTCSARRQVRVRVRCQPRRGLAGPRPAPATTPTALRTFETPSVLPAARLAIPRSPTPP
jgi:hypothetical protein